MSNDVLTITTQDITDNRESLLEFFSEIKNKKFDFSFLVDGHLSESWVEDYICDSLNGMTVQLNELKGFEYKRTDPDFSSYRFSEQFARDLLSRSKPKEELELNFE